MAPDSRLTSLPFIFLKAGQNTVTSTISYFSSAPMPSSTWAVSKPPLASHLASTGRYWGQDQGLEDLGELKKHLWGIRGDDIEAWTRDGLHSLAPASWHPSFRCYSSWLSLQGCLLSLLTFIFTWWTALIAVILLLLLTPFCKKPGEEGQVGKGVRE